jgi:hypothetical protein
VRKLLGEVLIVLLGVVLIVIAFLLWVFIRCDLIPVLFPIFRDC